MTTLIPGSGFIELNRTFRELSEESGENDDVDTSQAFGSVGSLCWPNLIDERRLIILSKAGAGKTTEIRNVADTLQKQKKCAFFIRLEHISGDFEHAFEVGTYEAFEEWLKSEEEGWLLLDSVDEARLRSPTDFELAIRKLSRRIRMAYNRTHIVITSRTAAWRPKTDIDHCAAQFPLVNNALTLSPQADDCALDESSEIEIRASEAIQRVFKIVTLNDLDPNQVEKFARTRGIQDSDAFLDAVRRADAWSFTSRPQDLEELTKLWINHHQIGTRLEIIKSSTERRMAERDQGRAEARPLSVERTQQGMQLLAAATTLAQEPRIGIPDGADNSIGIAIRSVLADWNDNDQSTLLSRPIFDEAIYGAVRFHHRSVREYLTAEWFAELLSLETSREIIEGLFFRNQYGLEVIVPTLRPILPWLVIHDEKIRERTRKLAPEVFFEGGDPSQLPLELRRRILHETCEQISSGTARRSMHDYSAAQFFANIDLVNDVRNLIQRYSGNDDLTAFLLHIVSIGQLKDAQPEAMSVALAPHTERYARINAFRAIRAIGSEEDQEHVRQSFLSESTELNREWLADLIDDVQPTNQSMPWVLASIEKSTPANPYSVDKLKESVAKFVNSADIKIFPEFVIGLNRLLGLPPIMERRYCEVSEKFQWLIEPACKVVEQLILARHPASIETDTLAVLHKLSAMHSYMSGTEAGIGAELSELVPAWQDLNQSLFWFEINKAREMINGKNEKRITDFQQASISGTFWRFKIEDFDYVVKMISLCTLLDDQLVALSLAFDLYIGARRPRAWREQLKRTVKNSDELSDRLRSYLQPSAMGPEYRRWKRREARWKKRNEAHQRKQEQYHTDWKKRFNDDLEDMRRKLHDSPGTITNPQYYLHQQIRGYESKLNQWTNYNWKALIPDYGEDIARFYRDSTVAYWRNKKPKLRSEGASLNQTTRAVIIGLTGLEIEANEIEDWTKTLNATEVELACRYASFELNGFPTWFPRLFKTYPEIVCEFIMREIRYELSIEKQRTDTNYVINDVTWSGQWAWDKLAPNIYKLLSKEPKNLSNLDRFLKIIQGSNLSDKLIEKLASRKCRTVEKLDHLARWFAVWTGVAPADAIVSLRNRIAEIEHPQDQTEFAMTFVTYLFDSHRGNGAGVRQNFRTPGNLKSLCMLMHEHIRREEDIDRIGKGVYSPGLRDNAQDARDNLFSLLSQIPGKESFLALMDLEKTHPDEKFRSQMMLHAKTRAEQDSDIELWTPEQVRHFSEKIEMLPRNHRELAEMAVFRLLNLKGDIEHGDSSLASMLQTVTRETDIRKYIGRELREKAFGIYSIPQEEELADAKKPDLRFHGAGFDAPVPVELKLADNWSGPKLFERLERQLCHDYLRDNRSNRGIFLLVYRGQKTKWDLPDGCRVDFSGLVTALEKHWSCISPKFPRVEDIAIIGIDLTVR